MTRGLMGLAALSLLVAVGACATPLRAPAWVEVPDHPGEPHLRNVRQLTFGGQNAEAYWSWDDERLVFQMRDRRGIPCDQIFVMEADGTGERMVSTGRGATTCSYFLPGDREIIYASTHHVGERCPEAPPPVPGVYTWPLHDFDVFKVTADGGEPVALTSTPGYDAEATVAADGRIVFTSARDGDLEIYTMNADGGDVRRLTNTPGYDGGPFFSADGTKIVYRAGHPEGADLAKYKDLLAKGLVQPTRMEIWVMDAAGSNQRQVTHLGGANFAPYFHPDGTRILFASNHKNPRSRNFDLYMVNVDGTGLEQVTTHEEFDSFPMFTKDGKRLVWASNRNAAKQGDTNVFVADWVE